jgi:hypothetical protein
MFYDFFFIIFFFLFFSVLKIKKILEFLRERNIKMFIKWEVRGEKIKQSINVERRIEKYVSLNLCVYLQT